MKVNILNKLKKGRLIAFDQDKAALKNSIKDDLRFIMINKNFRYLKQQLELLGISTIDGLIADELIKDPYFGLYDEGN